MPTHAKPGLSVKELSMKLWKLRICCGWFKGNPVVGFKLSIFEPLEDYPSGWQGVNLFGFMFLRFEFGIWLNKLGA